MLRGILVSALLATACSKGGGGDGANGPAVVAGATVGVVVEIGGKVTATRGGATRDLAAGAQISGDDKIATGDDGRVAIELAHNGAKWSLGANKSGVVSESVAWALPKSTGPAGTNESDMTAGGRHAEKSAADTGATAGSAMAPPPPIAAPVAPAPAAAAVMPAPSTPMPKIERDQNAPAPGGAAMPPPKTVKMKKDEPPPMAQAAVMVAPPPPSATELTTNAITTNASIHACFTAKTKVVVHCAHGACASKTKTNACFDKAISTIVVGDANAVFDLTLELAP